jgi:hypothetical protein
LQSAGDRDEEPPDNRLAFACRSMSARSLETKVIAAPAENIEKPGRFTGALVPGPVSPALVAAALLLVLLPVPFVFTHGPVWAAQSLLPPLQTAGWIALAFNAAAFLSCSLRKRLCTSVGVLTYRLAYLYGGIAWLSGLVLTYLLWGTGAVVIGIVCLGGGVVTTGLLATLIRGEWLRFLTLTLFVALAFGGRWAGLRLARHQESTGAGLKNAAVSDPAAEPRGPSRASMGGRN